MPLTFRPKAGTILMCDFRGYVLPEMIKVRPVVIVSADHLKRRDLYTVVPLSTTAPVHVQPYHYRFSENRTPFDADESWAKCDMLATVSSDRLDRIKVSRGKYVSPSISYEELTAIRICIKYVLSID